MTDTKPVPVPPNFYTKTMENLRNLREIHDHDDTLHRFLGDAEVAIANLIVLEAETAKERDAAQADATRYAFNEDREKARAASEEKHLREVNEGLRERLARERVNAQHLANERDEARASLNVRDTTLCGEVDRLTRERDAAEANKRSILIATNATPTESGLDAVYRVVKERDFARFHLESMEGSFKIAQAKLAELSKERDDLNRVLESSSHIHVTQKARKAAEDERDAAILAHYVANERANNWSLRYGALFAQSIHLAREVDRLKSEKAAAVEAKASAPDLFPIGTVVQYVEDGRRARVAGTYTFSDGSKFLRVEGEAHGRANTFHWRESLCRGVAPEIDPSKLARWVDAFTVFGRATFKVGDRVVNVADGNTRATVIGLFESIDGDRFVAVETTFGKSYFWRVGLCNPAPVNS